ncbi:MAG: bifunctional UDP-sugar hydrolase/5'-nucleotidase [Alphaproteobacteria bacterium]
MRFIIPLLTVGFVAGAAHLAHAEYDLTILHTNDFHARFQPISKYDSGCSAEDNQEGKCFGGSARLVTAIADARTRDPNAILVDGGDQFQGTLFYTYYKGKMAAEMMNKLKYDAMTVGNHEFDDGPETLSAFVKTVDFPVLMSNADFDHEPALANYVLPHAILERGGIKIGMIGLTPQDTHELASPGPNVIFKDPAESVQTQVDLLTQQGIDKIIVLSHSGYKTDLEVAAATTGVDVIVGGHSNTYLSNDDEDAAGPYPTMVGNTAIVQAYAYGKFLGELKVSFDDQGLITKAAGAPLIMDKAVAEDSATVDRINVLAQPLEEIRTRVVASSAAPIDGDRANCRAVECEMGNVIADAMLAETKDKGIQIALQNGGGIRASIDAGEVTMGEVLTVLPFQNTLSTFKATGRIVLEALENGTSQLEDGAGRFLQVAGLRYRFDPNAPAGKRITNVMVEQDGDYKPLVLDQTYGVVANNYVRGGGDGFTVFRDHAVDPYDFGPDLADVLAAYLSENSPYQPMLDGRIQLEQ